MRDGYPLVHLGVMAQVLARGGVQDFLGLPASRTIKNQDPGLVMTNGMGGKQGLSPLQTLTARRSGKR